MRMVLTVEKAIVYGRPLSRGDEFNVPDKEAALWAALGRAKNSMGSPDVAAPSSETDEIAAMRAEYKIKTGRDPDMRWGAGRLKNELQRGTYGRRDMRAED